jgi:hypothetical protein
MIAITLAETVEGVPTRINMPGGDMTGDGLFFYKKSAVFIVKLICCFGLWISLPFWK